MYRFLLLVMAICFISPLLYANEPQVCKVQAGHAQLYQQLGYCKKGDVLIIETAEIYMDVILAAQACVMGTVEVFLSQMFESRDGSRWMPRSFCTYNGKLRQVRFTTGRN